MLLCFSCMSALEPRCWKAEELNAAAESLDSTSWSARSPAEVSWLAAEAWWRADWIRWCSALLTSLASRQGSWPSPPSSSGRGRR